MRKRVPKFHVVRIEEAVFGMVKKLAAKERQSPTAYINALLDQHGKAANAPQAAA